MTDGSIMVSFHTSFPTGEVEDVTLETLADLGFDVEDPDEPSFQPSGDKAYSIRVDHADGWSVDVTFDLAEDRDPRSGPVMLGGLTDNVYPPNVHSEERYRPRMDVFFELLCRLTVVLEAEYVALFDTEGRMASVAPDGRPYAEAVDEPPRIGAFSPSVLEAFGGLDALYDDPWYVADLPGGQTLVIESDEPWSFDDWEPPTDAPYLESAELGHDGAGADQPPSEHSDPFAELEPGDYGTALGVHPDDIEAEFRNDDLRLERVYVAEDDTLRRVSDDAFVRHVIEGTSEDPATLLHASLANVPPSAGEDHQLASALFHWAIPPEFVRLEHPDGENVLTRLVDLEVDLSKYDLLLVLGDTTRHEEFDSDEDLETIEGALDTLEEFATDESIEGVERVIRERLF